MATISLTASGEFMLAQLSGWPVWVAWALPLGIDVYVVQSFRRHRDVAGALILMVAANAIYHLAAAGLVGVDRQGRPLWWLIVCVAAIAPWVMWRIHQITKEADETGHGETTTDGSAAETETHKVEDESESNTPVSLHSVPAATGSGELSVYETGTRETAPRETTRPVTGIETTGRTRETSRSRATSNETGSSSKALAKRGGETRRSSVSQDEGIEAEVAMLLSLMYQRKGPKTVSLDEAASLVKGSRATAGRRLDTARARYAAVG
jgi:hypothetical protein